MKRSTLAKPERPRRGGARAPLCLLPQPLPWQQARRVLAFVPHPDDECIGCGGLLVHLAQAGVPVRVVLVTDGSGAGGLPPGADLVRQQEFRNALGKLGVQDHVLLGLPDGGLVLGRALFGAVARELRAFGPDWVLCPSAADAHRDHRCVALAVQRAARAWPGVQRVLQYETWGALPTSHVLDITDVLATKMAALAEHTTALQQMDYAGATAGLARYRGLLVASPRPGAAGEAYLSTERATGFGWPAGLGRPEGWKN